MQSHNLEPKKDYAFKLKIPIQGYILPSDVKDQSCFNWVTGQGRIGPLSTPLFKQNMSPSSI